MKVLSPEAKGHVRAASESLWNDLFNTLSVVTSLQLVVCPDSVGHAQESLASSSYKSLKRTYEHLSGGITFYDFESIRLQQIAQIVRCYLKKEPLQFDFDPRNVTHGNLRGWSDRILISVDGVLPGMAESVRASRSVGHKALEAVFEGWRLQKPSFGQVFDTEKRSYQDTLLLEYRKDCEKRARTPAQIAQGKVPPLEEMLPSASERLMAVLEDVFRGEVGDNQVGDRMLEFFKTGILNEAPFNIIMSAMFASIAAKAAAGQKEAPNQGTLNDVNMVSALLPYCDAMFVDNKCRAILSDIPKAYKLAFPCVVFSPNVGNEFIAYLKGIRDSATEEHVKLVKEVYGLDALKPRAGIYGLGKFRKSSDE